MVKTGQDWTDYKKRNCMDVGWYNVKQIVISLSENVTCNVHVTKI